MKYIKMLGLLAAMAAALMAFAGTASAKLTEASGDPVDNGEAFRAGGDFGLDGSIDIYCIFSTMEGSVTAAGGTSIKLSSLTFSNCGTDTVTALAKGTLSINSFNEVFSTGAEVTAQLHRSIFGLPITTHCIYSTSNTNIGSLIESNEAESKAIILLNSFWVPQKATDSACGETATWTGGYFVHQPSLLYVD
jgi:hypothetical protein